MSPPWRQACHCSLLCPQGLAHSRGSVSTCWMNEWWETLEGTVAIATLVTPGCRLLWVVSGGMGGRGTPYHIYFTVFWFLNPVNAFFKIKFKMPLFREFPGGPVVRNRHFHCQGLGLIPGWGTEILQATPCGQIKKKKCTCLKKQNKTEKGIHAVQRALSHRKSPLVLLLSGHDG